MDYFFYDGGCCRFCLSCAIEILSSIVRGTVAKEGLCGKKEAIGAIFYLFFEEDLLF